ncbi:COPE [Cordylochernes scorpioides]|uniref:Coatomer subunit epsilon n=1 Tax=Cordylochernes scorpioides TaxID=51811 RepID=A0ABY6JY89_9ARAC|nr:COPE [Cordylochernes scorpioides]
MAPSQPDILFDIKNAYYIGNFQHCINEAQKLKAGSAEEQQERDMYMYRAYIAQKKYRVVLDEVDRRHASPDMLAIRMLADYLASGSDINKKFTDFDGIDWRYLRGRMFQGPSSQPAGRTPGLSGPPQPHTAADGWLHLLLAAGRCSDLSVSLGQAVEKRQESFYIYQELSDKYSPTPILLNGQVAALGCQGKYEDADTLAQEALDKVTFSLSISFIHRINNLPTYSHAQQWPQPCRNLTWTQNFTHPR